MKADSWMDKTILAVFASMAALSAAQMPFDWEAWVSSRDWGVALVLSVQPMPARSIFLETPAGVGSASGVVRIMFPDGCRVWAQVPGGKVAAGELPQHKCSGLAAGQYRIGVFRRGWLSGRLKLTDIKDQNESRDNKTEQCNGVQADGCM